MAAAPLVVTLSGHGDSGGADGEATRHGVQMEQEWRGRGGGEHGEHLITLLSLFHMGLLLRIL